MNNLASDHSLPEGSVRNIVNADVDELGRIRRRKGLNRVYAGVGVRDGFSCPVGELFVEAGVLNRLNADNTATPLLSGMIGCVTYHHLNGVVYMSDGLRTYKLVDGTVREWGLSPPPAPALSGASGNLGAGVYVASMVWVDGDGVESGSSPLATINLVNGGGITFANIPSMAGRTPRLYLSTANGTVLYHVADTWLPSLTVASASHEGGTTLETRGVTRPLPGRIIRDHNGRIYVADDTGLVLYSDPFAYDHFRLGESYLLFPWPITLMEPVKGGIFFGSDKSTFFYAGGPEEGFDVREVLGYGAVLGASVRRDDGSVMWQSQRGAVIGGPDGSVQNVQEKNVATDYATSGAAILREEDGVQQFIASLKGTRTNSLAAKSWIDAEVIRRGA